MSTGALRGRTLALAGVFQAVKLVDQVAHTGRVDAEPFAASIRSVLTLEAEDSAEVYGGVAGLTAGLEALCGQLDPGEQPRELPMTRYVIALMHLERKLMKRRQATARLREGISRAREQALAYSQTHPNVLANLADLYAQIISPLGTRIMVSGEPLHLNNPDNANRIRALLLAGIRSTVLWRRCGGTRLNLLLGRQRVVLTARSLLAAPEAA